MAQDKPFAVELRHLLADPHLQHVRVLAGSAGLGRRADRIVIVQEPLSAEPEAALLWVNSEEMATSAMLDVIVRRAASGGAAGVMGPFATVPRASLLLADRVRLPVLDVTQVDALVVVERLAVRRELVRVLACERVDAAVGAVVEAYHNGEAPEGIVARLGEVLEARATLAPEPPGEVNGDGASGVGTDEGTAAVTVRSAAGDLFHAHCALRAGGGPSHVLAVEMPNDDVAEYIVRRVLPVTATLVEARLVERYRSWEQRYLAWSDMFRALLQGERLGPETMMKLREMGWDLAGHHTVAVVRVHREPDVSRTPERHDARTDADAVDGHASDGKRVEWGSVTGTWDLSAFEVVERAFSYVGREAGLWSAIGPVEGATCAIAIRAAESATLDMACVKRVVASACQRVADELKATVSAGVGTPGGGHEALARSYREALQALTVGGVLHGPGHVTCVQDLGWRRHLYGWYMSDEGQTLAGATLRPLLELPPSRRAAAMATLDAYLRSGGSVTRTAEELFMHPNTVRYRLRWMAEQLAVDLEDPETRLVLKLALEAYIAARP